MDLPVSLPTCFAMKIKQNAAGVPKFLYLRAGHDKEDFATFTEMGTSEALTSSTHTRFYVVPSKKHGDEQLVHIKSSYNNKYLVAKKLPWRDLGLLVGTADEPDEESSKPSGTLFKVELDNKSSKPQSGEYQARFSMAGEVCQFVSYAYENKLRNYYVTIILVDVANQIILPQYVAFKGANDSYLRVADGEHHYLEFTSKDIADTSATFSTLNYADGTICMKSAHNSNFVGLRNNWLCAEKPDISHDTKFRALKYGEFFALQSMDNKQFCIASTVGNIVWINAVSESITENAKLRLEEPVLSREIYNIECHRIDLARIYDTTDMNMATASAINRTSEKNTVKSSMSITTTESNKYESTVTHKGNVSATVSGGFSLFKLIDMNVQVQAGYEGSKARTWGNASQNEKKQEIEYEVSVPANKKVTLNVTAKQAKYDVPFSYTQKDKLPNGEVRIYNYDDGLYSGMNCFDLRYETREEEIEPKKEEKETNKEELETSAKKRKGMAE